MEILREPELQLEELKVEDIYNEIYLIALSSNDDLARVKAWSLLIDYKRFNESAEERKEMVSNLMATFSRI